MLTHTLFSGRPHSLCLDLSSLAQLLDARNLVESIILAKVNSSYLQAIADQFEFHKHARSKPVEYDIET